MFCEKVKAEAFRSVSTMNGFQIFRFQEHEDRCPELQLPP